MKKIIILSVLVACITVVSSMNLIQRRLHSIKDELLATQEEIDYDALFKHNQEDEVVIELQTEETTNVKKEVLDSSKYEAVFEDCNGELITVGAAMGESNLCLYPKSFGNIIGYNNKYDISGLREFLFEEKLLYGEKRYFAQLTIDAKLQNYCYDLLGKEAGSITIMKDTGELLAYASKSKAELDISSDETVFAYLMNLDKNQESEVLKGFENQYTNQFGRVFTYFSYIVNRAAPWRFTGNEIYHDIGLYRTEDGDIYNVGYEKYGDITEKDALLDTNIQTYFAILAQDAYFDFLVNHYGLNKTLSFELGEIENDINLSNCSDYEIATVGNGQSDRFTMSPLFMQVMFNSFMNDKNEVYKPFLINKVYSKDSNIELYVGHKEKVADGCAEVSGFVQEALLLIGKDIFKENLYAVTSIDERQSTLLVGIPETDFSICISLEDANKTTDDLIVMAKAIMNFIEQN